MPLHFQLYEGIINRCDLPNGRKKLPTQSGVPLVNPQTVRRKRTGAGLCRVRG